MEKPSDIEMVPTATKHDGANDNDAKEPEVSSKSSEAPVGDDKKTDYTSKSTNKTQFTDFLVLHTFCLNFIDAKANGCYRECSPTQP
jgi:hypothetical protein